MALNKPLVLVLMRKTGSANFRLTVAAQQSGKKENPPRRVFRGGQRSKRSGGAEVRRQGHADFVHGAENAFADAADAGGGGGVAGRGAADRRHGLVQRHQIGLVRHRHKTLQRLVCGAGGVLKFAFLGHDDDL